MPNLLFPLTESSVFFPQASFAVEEDIGELLIPVHRRGDVSEELMVVCYTQQGAIHSIHNLIYALVFMQTVFIFNRMADYDGQKYCTNTKLELVIV